jgi:triacylglycerol lipase
LADRLRDSFLLRVAAGPSGRQLGTDLSSVPVALGPVDFEVGIIAGNRSLNPILSHLIPGADDGRVAVERTKVEGMADFIAVPGPRWDPTKP